MKPLSKNQLQCFALVCSVIGLFGWVIFEGPAIVATTAIGFIGLPIFIFNLTEGFELAGNNRLYGRRLIIIWVISIIPFWIYFYKFSFFKQSLAFDLMLCFFILSKLNAKYTTKAETIAFTGLMMLLSLFLSAFPILPEALTIILYCFRGDENKKKRRLGFLSVVFAFTAFSVLCTQLGMDIFICDAGKPWYYGLAPLGMLLVLPFTGCYSGKEGRTPVAHYFFYVVYPSIYIALGALGFLQRISYFYFFAGVQGVLVVISAVFMWYIGKSRLTGSVVRFTNMIHFAYLFFLGYFMEFTMSTEASRFISFRIQLGSFFLVVSSATLFAAGYCRIGFSRILQRIIYYINVICAIFVIVFPNTNNIIYTKFIRHITAWFPRDIVEFGIVLKIILSYFILLSMLQVIFCFYTIAKTGGAEKLRCIWLLGGIAFPWITFWIWRFEALQGYQIVNFGILLCMICDMIAMVHYGMTDPVQLASNNFLDHAVDGIMILDQGEHVVYFNEVVRDLIPSVSMYMEASNIFDSGYEDLIVGQEQVITIKKRSYKVVSEPLIEANYLQGYLVRINDITAQIEELNAAKSIGYTDSLTKLATRRYYELKIHDFFQKYNIGSFFYLDVDDFKHVNDDYSHETGDKVLRALANAMIEVAAEKDYYTCRLGGDEFSMFLPNECRYNNVGLVAQKLIDSFHEQLIKDELPEHITISVGIVTTDSIDDNEENPYKELYNKADAALYNSKRTGKNRFCFYKEGMQGEKKD